MKTQQRLRARIHRLVEAPSARDVKRHFDWFDLMIVTLIVVSVVVGVVETVPSIRESAANVLRWIEYGCALVFAVEYVLRLWTCVENPRYARPIVGRLRCAVSPMVLVDLLSFLPTLLPFVAFDLMILRTIRLARYSRALVMIGRVVASRREELRMLGFAMIVVLLISASLMYQLEREAQPEVFSSIPAALWWSVITLTTIGYGDVYPVTMWGKFVGGFVALCGVAVVALPTAVIGSAFAHEVRHAHGHDVCPHCGKQIVGD